MRLTLTAEQRDFAAGVSLTLREIATRRPTSPHSHSAADLIDFQRRLNDAGLAAVAWPERYGGTGLGVMEYAIVCDELGRSRSPELVNFVGIDVIAPALMRYEPEEKLMAWLPRMASAEDIWCQLFSEPDAGSDLASLRTRATRIPDGWLIQGQKVWSTWAHHASWGLLLARTGTTESRHRGITAFTVDMSTPGITIKPLRTMTGSTEFAEVFFDRVLVHPDSVVGEVNKGWDVAQVMLTAERGQYAIRRSAVLRAALIGLQTLLPDTNDVGFRRRVAEATVDMEVLDLRISSVIDQLCTGQEIGAEAALTKLMLGQVEQRIFSAAALARGMATAAWPAEEGAGWYWSDGFLYSRAATIYGGSQEIQRNIIAERLLGLPR